MIVLCLTGSIGMGKSTTAAFFREAGVPVWDADSAVHDLYAAGGAAVEPLSQLYPGALRNGTIDRTALRGWIARDESALGKIEKIVHPLVARDRARFVEEHRNSGTPLVVLDIPLLFENGTDSLCDAVVVVSAPPEVQRDRVLQRAGMTEDHFETILARQLPDAEKRARATYVIETLSIDQARADVLALIDRLMKA